MYIFIYVYTRVWMCVVYEKSDNDHVQVLKRKHENNTLKEMFSVKYRVAISVGEVDLFLFDPEQ